MTDIMAADLRVGDVLTVDGAPATVTSVEVTLFGAYVVYATCWQQWERAGSETFHGDTTIEVQR